MFKKRYDAQLALWYLYGYARGAVMLEPADYPATFKTLAALVVSEAERVDPSLRCKP